MRRRIAMSLALALAVGPTLTLWGAAPAAASPPAPAAGAPALPDMSAPQDLSPAADVKAAPVEVPSDLPVQPGPAKPQLKPGRFRLGNFVLGFVGGALLGSAAGVLFGSTDANGALVQDRLKYMLPLGVLGGGLLGGTVSLLLGATSPPEAAPPALQGRLGSPWLVATTRF